MLGIVKPSLHHKAGLTVVAYVVNSIVRRKVVIGLSRMVVFNS